MFNIIRADLYRIVKGKGIYICLFVIALSFSASIFLKSAGHFGINTSMDMPSSEVEEIKDLDDALGMLMNNEEHPVDVDIMSTGGNIYYFLVFVVFIVFCTDVSNHTVKNVISSGISRKTYYLSKLVLSLAIGTILIVFQTYGGYFGNLLVNGSGYSSNIIDITIIMLRQLPIFYGIIGLLTMFSALLQKTARFNGVAIGFVMGVQLIITLIGAIFNSDMQPILQFEFESILRSMSVIGPLSASTLLIGVTTGFVMLLLSTTIGMQYFKKCAIK